MSTAIAQMTTKVLGAIVTVGAFLKLERSGIGIACAIELDVEAAGRSFFRRLFMRALC